MEQLTREQLLDFMAAHNACSPATTWVLTTTGTTEQLYAKCKNPQWMLWLAGEAGLRLPLVLAASDIARSVLKYVPKGEARPAAAIAVAELIGRGELTGTAAEAADADAWNAAYAAYAAAGAAAGDAARAAAWAAAGNAAWAAGDAARAAAGTAAGHAARAAVAAGAAAGNAGAAAYEAAGNAARAAQNKTNAKAVRERIPLALLARAIKDQL